jgi:hypothetical protein
MERPCRATQARRPAPLMTATWAAAAGGERVPARAAASVEIFRIAAACAKPAVCRFGLPLAERTANPAKVEDCRLSLGLPANEGAGLSVVEQKQRSGGHVMDGGIDNSEQHGFRRIVSTTFMMAFMFPRHINSESIERYMRSLIRAQADIDLQPEQFKHYFINEIPERFRDKVDVRRFGVGERVVPQPYTRAMFEKTQTWMRARHLFDGARDGGVSYEQAVTVV